MPDIKKIKRSFRSGSEDSTHSGLSPNVPLPNIVRIEILNAVSRNRYLGKIQQIASTLKDSLYANLRNKGSDKFYGFMKGNSQKTIDMSSNWAPIDNSGGGIIGTIRSLVAGGSNNAGPGINQFFELGRDLTGISMSTTGSSSIKRYSGSDLNQFSVECGWYIPEQYKICIKSLRSILSMAYPSELNVGDGVINKLSDGIRDTASETWKGTKNVIEAGKKVGVALYDTVIGKKEEDKSIETESKSSVEANVAKPTSDNSTKIADTTATTDTINAVLKAVLDPKLLDLFGKNLTFDPLPVRCCIGQFIDIEPLVISGVSITFSNETFVNSKGRHLPIFISVNIQFKFWMQPPPSLQFMQLLGEEMFGNIDLNGNEI